MGSIVLDPGVKEMLLGDARDFLASEKVRLAYFFIFFWGGGGEDARGETGEAFCDFWEKRREWDGGRGEREIRGGSAGGRPRIGLDAISTNPAGGPSGGATRASAQR